MVRKYAVFITRQNPRPDKEGIKTVSESTTTPPNGRQNPRPDKEGIKTASFFNPVIHIPRQNPRPDKEGIKTKVCRGFLVSSSCARIRDLIKKGLRLTSS